MVGRACQALAEGNAECSCMASGRYLVTIVIGDAALVISQDLCGNHVRKYRRLATVELDNVLELDDDYCG